MLAATGDDCLLPLQLGLAIHAQRAGGVAFLPGLIALTIEHIVGRVMHQPGTDLGSRLRQCGGRGGIEASGQFRFALGFVHRGMGRRIDDHVGAVSQNSLSQALWLAQIAAEIGAVPVQRQHLAQRGQAALQLPADLAVFAQQQDFHEALYCFCTHSR